MSTKVRFSYRQYQEMIRLGLFNPPEDHRVELIFGEILPKYGSGPMSPINPPHENAIDELTQWSFEATPPGSVRLRIQNSIGIPALRSQPEPDVAWMSPKRYSQSRPGPDERLSGKGSWRPGRGLAPERSGGACPRPGLHDRAGRFRDGDRHLEDSEPVPVPEPSRIASGVLLLIEVSDTTLSRDRGVKSRLYARAGIRDYWIVNIPGRCIEVRRDPVGSKYQDITIYRQGDQICPLVFPDVSLPVSRIFPD